MAALAASLAHAFMQWRHPQPKHSADSPKLKPAPSVALTIEDLPPELLLNILERLRDRRKNLHALCLTTSTLRTATTGILYREYGKSYHLTSLRPFLRTITKHPALARHLKATTITLYYGVPQSPAFKEYVDFFQAITAVSNFPKLHARLSLALKKGRYDAEAALLMLCSGSVEVMTLDMLGEARHNYNFDVEDFLPSFSDDICLVAELLRTITCNYQDLPEPKPFDRLRSLTIIQNDLEKGSVLRLPFSTALALLRLPSLEDLALKNGIATSETATEDSSASGKSSVRNLTVVDFSFDTSALQTLLDRCNGLEKLCISRCSEPGAFAARALNPRDLRQALSRHAGTLERLTFDFGYGSYRQQTICDWRRFTALQYLDTWTTFLANNTEYGQASWAGSDLLFEKGALDCLLPPNLDTLQLRIPYESEELPRVLRAFAEIHHVPLKCALLVVDPDTGSYGHTPYHFEPCQGIELTHSRIIPSDGVGVGGSDDDYGICELMVRIQDLGGVRAALLAIADKFEEQGLDAFEEPLAITQPVDSTTGLGP